MEQSPVNTNTSSLREQLARRLSVVYHAAIPGVPFTGRRAAEYEGLLDVADECIRQMEWARRKAIAETHHGVDATVDEGYAPTSPLTAAPDDWNPKETHDEGV